MSHQYDLFLKEEDLPDPPYLKQCNGCGKHLPVEEFGVYQPKQGKAWEEGLRRASCKECHSEGEKVCRDWRKKNPLPQDFRCPICNMSHGDFKAAGRYLSRSPFAVDHCHKTMTVRGWVCNPCNSSMGFIKDDVKAVSNMLEFLKKDHNA